MKEVNRRRLGVAVMLAFASATCGAAEYPEKPVRIIVPSAPGGGTDTTMRIISPKLGEVLGQRVLLDNRPGQSGNIGVEIASRAAPDGYTLAAMIASNASNASVMKTVPYNLERDFAPIARIVTMPNVLTVHPSLPVRNVKELVAFARARPAQIYYGSPGFGSTAHLAMELLMSMTRIKMMHVPYKSGGAVFVAVQSGETPMTFGNIMSSLQHVKNGRLRALGVTSLKRAGAAPDIPTIAEQGLAGYEANTWYGMLAPAAVPREIVLKLHKAVVTAANDPGVVKLFTDSGADMSPSASPEEFGEVIRAEVKKWAVLVKTAGIVPE